jgi:hypothetical protein
MRFYETNSSPCTPSAPSNALSPVKRASRLIGFSQHTGGSWHERRRRVLALPIRLLRLIGLVVYRQPGVYPGPADQRRLGRRLRTQLLRCPSRVRYQATGVEVSGARTLWGRGRPVILGSRPMSTRRRLICKGRQQALGCARLREGTSPHRPQTFDRHVPFGRAFEQPRGDA